MARTATPLTVARCNALKPGPKTARIFDGGGLYLEVKPNGSKYWRMKYRYNGKELLASFGVFPEVSLAEARAAREEVRRKLRHDEDPRRPSTLTVAGVAASWVGKNTPTWSAGHLSTVQQRLDHYILPVVGDLDIARVKCGALVELVQKVERRGTIETAHRVRQILRQIWRHAMAHDHVQSDITQGLAGVLQARRTQHMAATTDEAALRSVLRAIWGYDGSMVVKTALQIAPVVMVRPGELRQMRWDDIDGTDWKFSASKTGQPHIVPLPTQVQARLDTLREFARGPYVFPNPRALGHDRPMSDNALGAALRRMDIRDQTIHGFRATARTLLDEKFGYPVAVIEMQLAHSVRDPLGTAYNRTSFLEDRREMLQAWADYVEGLAND